VCVRAYVCVCVRAYVCVCVCVCEREWGEYHYKRRIGQAFAGH